MVGECTHAKYSADAGDEENATVNWWDIGRSYMRTCTVVHNDTFVQVAAKLKIVCVCVYFINQRDVTYCIYFKAYLKIATFE